jgi:TolB-like protein/Tfp pilus assembly protein PilF/preprotein translocase subunit Sec61beta
VLDRGRVANGIVSELKRRKVFRVAVVYAAMAFALLQAADIMLPRLGVPEWGMSFIVLLVVLGFPVALVLAWALEITPAGLRVTPSAAPEELAQPQPSLLGKRTVAVSALLVAVGIGLGAGWFLRPAAPPAPAEAAPAPAAGAPARSIAVLAFEDLSPDGDQVYFAEGISEELLNLLARIEGFKVAARTSSFKFKGRQADIGEIGRALNVETVLEGSVRKAGDQVRVTAQLIEVSSGYHLWSESYDRRLENIFAVQDEIAAAIIQALRLQFDIAAETAARTENVLAYDHYLRGRQLAREPTRAGLLRGIEAYEQAIAIDPGFAAAYSGIAEAWIWLEDYGGFRSSEAFPRAEQAARRALALDPQSAEAHAAMAFVRDRYYADKPGAKDYFEQTLRINPNYVTAYNLYGDTLRDLGEMERMIEVHRAAVELDPLSVFMRTRLASKLQLVGRFEEAEAILAEVLAEYPGNDFAIEELGNIAQNQGRAADSIREFRILHFARPGDPYAAAQIARAGVELGDRALADAWIAEARAIGADNRWELAARQPLAESSGDWTALEELGQVWGGPRGAYLRGVAASRLEAWPAARRHLLESLQLAGYDAVRGARMGHADALLELAWVERNMGLPDWDERLQVAEPVLEALRPYGPGLSQQDYFLLGYGLARVAALRDDRAGALAHLQSLAGLSLTRRWFLERDPVFARWRDDPEFLAVVEQMTAHAEAERAKLAGMEMFP